MTAWQTVWEVARWEFRRFLKPKQLLISLVTTLVAGAVGVGVARFVNRADVRTLDVAVIGGERLGLGADTVAERVALRPQPAAAEDSLRAAVAARELDGLLVVRDSGPAELVARRDPAWRATLAAALSARAQARRLAASGMDPAALTAVLAPVEVAHRPPPGGARGAGRGERVLTIGVLALSFVGLMSGMGFVFAGITGEKQQRVTEQLVSIIPPQRWIDGKILGLAAVAAVNTLATALAFAALILVFAGASGRLSGLALSVQQPLLVPLLVLLPLLGFGVWFAFLCAVAATIDDPHTSQKGSLLMLPMLPVAIAGVLFARADSAVAQFFAILPVTSHVVLPVRLLLTDVPWWEVALALALLVATIWVMRRAAGKIFATGILMYGKEPTAREMWRWVREA